MSDACEHEEFSAVVAVQRLTDDAGLLNGFMADVNLTCASCGKEFVWLDQPTTNFDGTTLQCPVAPSHAWTGPGTPSRLRGFSVHPRGGSS